MANIIDTNEKKQVRITILRHADGSKLGKTYKLDSQGQMTADTGGSQLSKGEAQCVVLPIDDDLPQRLRDTTTNVGQRGMAYLTGEFRHAVNGHAHPVISTKLAQSGIDGQTRTIDATQWPQGPTVCHIDYDPSPGDGVYPADWQGKEVKDAADKLIDILCEAVPSMISVPIIISPSPSHGIRYNGKRVKPPGYHLAFVVSSGTEIPRFGKIFQQRLWALGYGRIDLAKDGSMLERTLIDTAVFSPERVVYEARAVNRNQKIGNNTLTQDLCSATIREGFNQYLDLKAIKNLTQPEVESFEAKVRLAKEQHYDQSREMRAAWEETAARTLCSDPENPISDKTHALSLVRSRIKGVLMGEDSILLESGAHIQVKEILENPEVYHENLCYDPIEPDYDGGRAVGILFTNFDNQQQPTLHSKAHGGRSFKLCHSAESIRKRLAILGEEGNLDKFGREWPGMLQIAFLDEVCLESTLQNISAIYTKLGTRVNVSTIQAKYNGLSYKMPLKILTPEERLKQDIDLDHTVNGMLSTGAVNDQGILEDPTDIMGGHHSNGVYSFGGIFTDDVVIDALNRYYGLATIGNKTQIVSMRYNLKMQHFQPVSQFPQEVASYLAPLKCELQDGNRIKIEPAFKVWQNSSRRRTYTNTDFNPRPGVYEETGRALPDGKVFDYFTGFPQRPTYNHDNLVEIIRFHLQEILCGGDKIVSEYFECWLADLFQNPSRRVTSSPVIKSRPGIGKGSMTDYVLKPLLGRYFTVISEAQKLTSNFNYYRTNRLFIVVNEATFGGLRSEKGHVNSMVTDEHYLSERKHHDAEDEKNLARVWFNSNEIWAVGSGPDDRRYFYPQPALHVPDDAYYKRLYDSIKEGAPQAFLGYLLQKDIRDWVPAKLPHLVDDETSDGEMRHDSNTELSMDPVTSFLVETFRNDRRLRIMSNIEMKKSGMVTSPFLSWWSGEERPEELKDGGSSPDDNEVIWYERDEVLEALRYYHNVRGGRQVVPTTSKGLSIQLNELGNPFYSGIEMPKRPNGYRRMVEGQRKTFYKVYPLEEGKQRIQQHLRRRMF